MVRVLSLSAADVSTRGLTPGEHRAAFGVWLGLVGGEAPAPNQYLYLRAALSRGCPQRHFGEYELSLSLIGLSPRTAHPNPFQRKPVRPSRRLYPTFSLAMRRSQSFASAPADCGALFGLAFAPAACLKALDLAGAEQLVGSLCKRHAVTAGGGSHSLQARGFRFCFTPLLAVLFTFPSRY